MNPCPANLDIGYCTVQINQASSNTNLNFYLRKAKAVAKWPSDVLPSKEPPAAGQQPAGHECPGRPKDDEPPAE